MARISSTTCRAPGSVRIRRIILCVKYAQSASCTNQHDATQASNALNAPSSRRPIQEDRVLLCELRATTSIIRQAAFISAACCATWALYGSINHTHLDLQRRNPRFPEHFNLAQVHQKMHHWCWPRTSLSRPRALSRSKACCYFQSKVGTSKLLLSECQDRSATPKQTRNIFEPLAGISTEPGRCSVEHLSPPCPPTR